MKNYILLAVSILAGGLAFFIAVVQIKKEREAIHKRFEQIEVTVFRRDMIKGEEIKREDLAGMMMFRQNLRRNEVLPRDIHLIVGRRLARDVPKLVAITFSDVVMPTAREGSMSEMARLVREGERAISISVDSVGSVTNLVQPNDHVDIIATFRFPSERGDQSLDTVTLTLLQNVTVLATGQTLPYAEWQGRQPARRGASYAQVTLAVTPKEAELLVFAQQKGNLVLSLRNGEDILTEQDLQDVNFQFLQDHIKEYQQERDDRVQQALRAP